MSDEWDRDGAAEFAVRCAGFTGDQKTLYYDQKDGLIEAGVTRAIASRR